MGVLEGVAPQEKKRKIPFFLCRAREKGEFKVWVGVGVV